MSGDEGTPEDNDVQMGDNTEINMQQNTEKNTEEIKYRKFEMPNISGIKNKIRRKEIFIKFKKMRSQVSFFKISLMNSNHNVIIFCILQIIKFFLI